MLSGNSLNGMVKDLVIWETKSAGRHAFIWCTQNMHHTRWHQTWM